MGDEFVRDNLIIYNEKEVAKEFIIYTLIDEMTSLI